VNTYPEGTTAVCRYCGESILLDQREGGGEGMDWGAGPSDWVGNGGIGMDYGCGDSPDTDGEGCGGHEPDVSTVKVPPPPVGTSVVEWAKVHGTHYRWMTALDNHEPTRNYAYGDLWTYPLRSDDGRGIVLDGSSQLKDRTKITVVVDDGETVRPYYVASWNANSADDYVILHPFPTNCNEDGTPRARPDGRLVDMSGWMIGPSKLYHLKVTKMEDGK